jgi:hypothetical protein
MRPEGILVLTHTNAYRVASQHMILDFLLFEAICLQARTVVACYNYQRSHSLLSSNPCRLVLTAAGTASGTGNVVSDGSVKSLQRLGKVEKLTHEAASGVMNLDPSE